MTMTKRLDITGLKGRRALIAIVLLAACGSSETTTVSSDASTSAAPAVAETAGITTAESAAVTTGETSAPAAETASSASAGTTVDGLEARTAVLQSAQWSSNVTITVDGSTATFESDGVPSHEVLDAYLGDGKDGKYLAGGVSSYDAKFSFPVVPTVADSSTASGNGAIGVAISGAVFFNPYEGNGTKTVANDDNEVIDGVPFIDACGGHPLPNGINYHYHGIPYCITDVVDTPGQHSVLIGYIFDGYGIYGPKDVGGAEPTDLDECMGHTGPTPEFGFDTYHYHVSSQANYITECYHGVATKNGR
jgi:YHYH protein